MTFRSMDLLQYFINYVGSIHYTSVDDPFVVITNFLQKVSDFKFQTYKPIVVDGVNQGMTEETFNGFGEVFNFAGVADLQEQFNSLFGDEVDHDVSRGGTEENRTESQNEKITESSKSANRTEVAQVNVDNHK